MCINWGVYVYQLGGVYISNWGVYVYQLGGVRVSFRGCMIIVDLNLYSSIYSIVLYTYFIK
jgi:hypothetical protein